MNRTFVTSSFSRVVSVVTHLTALLSLATCSARLLGGFSFRLGRGLALSACPEESAPDEVHEKALGSPAYEGSGTCR